MKEDIGVGIVGFGLAGRVFHAPLVAATPGLRLAAIVARSNADVARTSYPMARIVGSLEEMVEDESVRVVVVASPNATHAVLATAALEAGRDVVIDKPFATSSADAEKLIALAGKRGRLLTVFQNRRWDGDFLTVRSLLEAGEFGRVVLFESHFDRYTPKLNQAKPWKEAADASGDLLWDLGSHLMDQAMQLFGMPAEISADLRRERTGSLADDAFDLLLRYGSGLRAFLRASMMAAEAGPRFVMRGEAATFTKSGLDPQEAALRGGAIPGGQGWGLEPEENWGRLTKMSDGARAVRKVESAAGRYLDFYANLRDAVWGKAPPAVTAQQALAVMRMLELARESSRSRRALEVPQHWVG